MNKNDLKRLLIPKTPLLLIMVGVIICSSTVLNIRTQTSFHVKSLKKEVIINMPTKYINLYTTYYNEGDYLGSMSIPKLGKELPIYQGTTVNTLEKGIGHFIQSVLPGEKDNSVYSAHRDTAFAGIGNLVIGDQIILKTTAGTFTYAVGATRIVKADDNTVIVPTTTPTITLITCYPFAYLSSTKDRYVVSAALIMSE